MRTAVIGVAIVTLATGAARAQENRPWAEKLFLEAGSETSHDFKSVAHGSQLFHKFTFKNFYKVPLDVTITRVSCGCVHAVGSTKTVQPLESGTIDVTMNARQFTGARAVSIFVQFTQGQYFSTAELKVNAFSRTDVVFNPGQVQFGAVTQGQTVTKVIEVDYAGTLDWQVNRVDANGLPVEVRSERKVSQQAGQVGYKLTVTLKPEAPAGPLKGEMFLRTNDPMSPLVPVLVEANVQATLTVTPATLALRGLKADEEKTAKVVVRGARDFRVLAVDGQGEGVSVAPLPTRAASAHTLVIKVRRPAGEFRRALQIKTDAQEAPLTVTVEGVASP